MLPDIMRLAQSNPSPQGRRYNYSETTSSHYQSAALWDQGYERVTLSGNSTEHRESITGPDGRQLNYGEATSSSRHQAQTYSPLVGESQLDTETTSKTGYGVA